MNCASNLMNLLDNGFIFTFLMVTTIEINHHRIVAQKKYCVLVQKHLILRIIKFNSQELSLTSVSFIS